MLNVDIYLKYALKMLVVSKKKRDVSNHVIKTLLLIAN